MIVERVEIAKLVSDPSNARKHGERNLATIVGSLHRFGQQKPIVVDKANVVRAGNGTLEAARSLGWTHLDCVRTQLDGSDATAYAIADNRTSELAEWDSDVLVALLESLQSDDEALLEAAGFTDEELAELMPHFGPDGDGSDDTYTNKIVAPIYEPKGERPPLTDLLDRSKADSLIAEIKKADLPEAVKRFLFDAAERHVVFNFRQIAEFYCHANETLQDLMERSGLVIIDFDKAIECGFVHLTEKLGQLADLEESDNGDA